MGAGSAKGVNPENEEDGDEFSNTSDHWENDPPAFTVAKENAKNNNTTTNMASTKIIAEAAIASTSNVNPSLSNDLDSGDKKDEVKKKTRFGFTRKKEDEEQKTEENERESCESAKKDNTDKATKDSAKKEADRKGFRIFGWRKDEKKTDEKDIALDNDIDDLEKTFDSLGIVGKNMWGNETGKKKEHTVDDIELLEPMRKRKNVKVRGGKGMNGTASSSGSNGSKRTFKFSWETQDQKAETKSENDDWEYKAVVIEGFDIEKFRKANLKESMFDSTSLPNAVRGEEDDPGGSKSPLRYDQSEQYIMAAIERDFMH